MTEICDDRRGYVALEATGLVIAALSAPAVIHGVLRPDTAVLGGVLDWAPGGRAGQLALLGFLALVSLTLGGWAHTRPEQPADQAGDNGGTRGRPATPPEPADTSCAP
ncbi:hypothetical protein [Streptomyces lasiicapitis]|uniref:hypothetical protein n=1 Tax=Streptomyces lasiicapitis TaxID=1923961 RepID=UPI00365013DA